MSGLFSTPVVLLVFNRPEHTQRLLDRLRLVKPAQVLVVADGPRPAHPADVANCARVREVIARGIDWPAEVQTNFAEANCGLRGRVVSGLDWAFSRVDRAIILEDDCLPAQSFFGYCAELLEHYAGDERVGAISGDNFQPPEFCCGSSYYFSRYPHCWGWATWRRAWRRNDDQMTRWPALRESRWLEGLFPDPLQARCWTELFDAVHQRRIDTWDYPWMLACWTQNFLTALPSVNLVTNIGIGPDATHTKDAEARLHELRAHEIGLPLRHPPLVIRNQEADAWTQEHIYGAAKSTTLGGRLDRLVRKSARLPGRLRRMLNG